MKTLLTLAFALTLPLAALAQPSSPGRIVPAAGGDVSKYDLIVTPKGREYHAVTVTHATAGRIKLMHRDGIATLSLAEMPLELQTIFGYDEKAAAAEAVRMQAESALAAQAAETRRAEQAVILARQQSESAEISAIEKKGFIAEIYVHEKKPDGCVCAVWELMTEAVKGQALHSGKPVLKIVRGRQYDAFVLGLDAASGQTIQGKLMPVSIGQREGRSVFATTGSAAYRAQAAEKEARLAEQEARAKASREAAAARAAARAQASAAKP